MQDFNVKGFLGVCALICAFAFIVLSLGACTTPIPKPDESQLWRTVD